MNKERVIEVVKNYLNNAGIDTDEDLFSKVWSDDLGMDDVDIQMLISEVEDEFTASTGDNVEITIRDSIHVDELTKSTIEELVSFFISELQ